MILKNAIHTTTANMSDISIFFDQLVEKYPSIPRATLDELWRPFQLKADLQTKSAADLKKLCKEKGLKTSGTKQELIDRLVRPPDRQKPASKTGGMLKYLQRQQETIHLRKNTYGHYEHLDTGFIFDEKTQKVIGKQRETSVDGTEPIIDPLSLEDIETCKEYNFDYLIPNHLQTKN